MDEEKVIWEEPSRAPRGGPKGTTRYVPAWLVEACRENPGKWARCPGRLRYVNAASHVKRVLNKGPGRWETAARRAEGGEPLLYVCCVEP